MKVDIKAPIKDKKKYIAKSDPIMKVLRNLNDKKVDEWVDGNIKDMDDVREMFKSIMKTLSYVVHSLDDEENLNG